MKSLCFDFLKHNSTDRYTPNELSKYTEWKINRNTSDGYEFRRRFAKENLNDVFEPSEFEIICTGCQYNIKI